MDGDHSDDDTATPPNHPSTNTRTITHQQSCTTQKGGDKKKERETGWTPDVRKQKIEENEKVLRSSPSLQASEALNPMLACDYEESLSAGGSSPR